MTTQQGQEQNMKLVRSKIVEYLANTRDFSQSLNSAGTRSHNVAFPTNETLGSSTIYPQATSQTRSRSRSLSETNAVATGQGRLFDILQRNNNQQNINQQSNNQQNGNTQNRLFNNNTLDSLLSSALTLGGFRGGRGARGGRGGRGNGGQGGRGGGGSQNNNQDANQGNNQGGNQGGNQNGGGGRSARGRGGRGGMNGTNAASNQSQSGCNVQSAIIYVYSGAQGGRGGSSLSMGQGQRGRGGRMQAAGRNTNRTRGGAGRGQASSQSNTQGNSQGNTQPSNQQVNQNGNKMFNQILNRADTQSLIDMIAQGVDLGLGQDSDMSLDVNQDSSELFDRELDQDTDQEDNLDFKSYTTDINGLMDSLSKLTTGSSSSDVETGRLSINQMIEQNKAFMQILAKRIIRLETRRRFERGSFYKNTRRNQRRRVLKSIDAILLFSKLNRQLEEFGTDLGGLSSRSESVPIQSSKIDQLIDLPNETLSNSLISSLNKPTSDSVASPVLDGLINSSLLAA